MKPKKSSLKAATKPSETGAGDTTVPVVPAPAETPRTVLFDVHLGGAREVYLAGTFNDWHPTTLPMVDMGLGRWEKEIRIPPGTYEYLFIADGRWLPDPECGETTPNPFGGVNCVRRVG